MIPYGRQEITQDDIDAVEEVLQSDFLTQGPQVPKFEKVVSDYCGSKYAVAVNSATSALHIACKALGLKKVIGSGPVQLLLLPLLTVDAIAAPKLILLTLMQKHTICAQKHLKKS